jgi:xanthine/uracil/vitamin C permease (AzgA family)
MEILFIIAFFIALLFLRKAEKEQTEELIALRTEQPTKHHADQATCAFLVGMAILAVLLLLALAGAFVIE